MKKRAFSVLTAALLISACSAVSENIRNEAVSVSFQSLKNETEQFIDQTVILGGFILETRNLWDRSQIIVLQTPLGSRDRPENREKSQGRFMAVKEGFLDPEIYKKGMRITVAGTVIGQEKVKVQEYLYPLVKIKAAEIILWQEEPDQRRYYYDPFYDPFYPYPWLLPHRYGFYPYW